MKQKKAEKYYAYPIFKVVIDFKRKHVRKNAKNPSDSTITQNASSMVCDDFSCIDFLVPRTCIARQGRAHEGTMNRARKAISKRGYEHG